MSIAQQEYYRLYSTVSDYSYNLKYYNKLTGTKQKINFWT